MTQSKTNRVSALPAIERLLRRDEVAALIEGHGRPACTQALRDVVSAAREGLLAGDRIDIAEAALTARARIALEAAAQPHLRPVFNLTGTVLHTNLGRALLPTEAVTAMIEAATYPSNLEYDLDRLKRGDRDDHIEADLRALTGAEAATVVNNNAAAVLLVLNSLALRKEVPISRGELIEIGGSFRIPDVMARAGAKLREVGTTNRTHLKDFVEAINDKTGVVMRVHPSNFAIEGFTATADEAEIADACRARNVPFVVDLGSGALVDLRRFGLPHEPTPAETLAAGADLVTFSGDKLLGGPQAGIIVGRADLVARIKRNPMKRALRCDKVTLAALSAVLRLYRDPDRLVQRLPTFRALVRPLDALDDLAKRVAPALRAALVGVAEVEVIDCASQIGSGALPTNTVPSRGLAIRPLPAKRGAGAALKRIVKALSQLPTPVLGAVSNGALILDVRCLEDEDTFATQLAGLATKSV
jgi:L-seryl-tRNA(Ser) seleniumtransferase